VFLFSSPHQCGIRRPSFHRSEFGCEIPPRHSGISISSSLREVVFVFFQPPVASQWRGTFSCFFCQEPDSSHSLVSALGVSSSPMLRLVLPHHYLSACSPSVFFCWDQFPPSLPFLFLFLNGSYRFFVVMSRSLSPPYTDAFSPSLLGEAPRHHLSSSTFIAITPRSFFSSFIVVFLPAVPPVRTNCFRVGNPHLAMFV